MQAAGSISAIIIHFSFGSFSVVVSARLAAGGQLAPLEPALGGHAAGGAAPAGAPGGGASSASKRRPVSIMNCLSSFGKGAMELSLSH